MAAVVLAAWTATTLAADSAHLYVTWAGAEPDKGASAWYIKRHIDRDAVFAVQPAGSPVDMGTPFDTPFARFRRMHNASTLETLLREHPSRDPVIQKLARVTHDIEINLWQPKQLAESRVLEARIREIDASYGNGVPIQCFVALFDNVYVWLAAGRTDAESLRTPRDCQPSAAIK